MIKYNVAVNKILNLVLIMAFRGTLKIANNRRCLRGYCYIRRLVIINSLIFGLCFVLFCFKTIKSFNHATTIPQNRMRTKCDCSDAVNKNIHIRQQLYNYIKHFVFAFIPSVVCVTPLIASLHRTENPVYAANTSMFAVWVSGHFRCAAYSYSKSLISMFLWCW